MGLFFLKIECPSRSLQQSVHKLHTGDFMKKVPQQPVCTMERWIVSLNRCTLQVPFIWKHLYLFSSFIAHLVPKITNEEREHATFSRLLYEISMYFFFYPYICFWSPSTAEVSKNKLAEYGISKKKTAWPKRSICLSVHLFIYLSIPNHNSPIYISIYPSIYLFVYP